MPSEHSDMAARAGTARELEIAIGPALFPSQRSRIRSGLPWCHKIALRRSMLGATKLCRTSLCFAKLVHGCAQVHASTYMYTYIWHVAFTHPCTHPSTQPQWKRTQIMSIIIFGVSMEFTIYSLLDVAFSEANISTIP